MSSLKRIVLSVAAATFWIFVADRPALGLASAVEAKGAYAVVVSRPTWDHPEWKMVVDALRKKYDAALIVYRNSVKDAQSELSRIMPRYTCFVARPQEAGRDFVVSVHRMTRQLDDDPYTDVIWGILTGYNAGDALRIANRSEPLMVRRGLGGCGSLDLKAYDEGIKFDEGTAGGRWVKRQSGPETREDFPVDSTKGLVDALNEFKPDLFMTSGHATEKDWQIGYNYPDGSFRCEDGQLFGLDTQGQRYDIHSPNPKVFLPVGNCLIGHIPRRDCMALAMMHSAGVDQMFGYTAVTFYGFIGWGTYALFEGQRDRYTLAESFYLINQALVHQLMTRHSRIAYINLERYDTDAIESLAEKHQLQDRDELGLLWDRDVVAFYGDPAWEVRRTPGSPAWTQTLSEHNGTYTLTVTATRNDRWSKHPVMVLMPERIEDIRVTHGEELMPVVTDDLILLPLAGEHSADEEWKITFQARKAPANRTSASAGPIFADSTDSPGHKAKALEKPVPPLPVTIPSSYLQDVMAALGSAGNNAAELIQAISDAPPSQRQAVCFLIANMPQVDLQTLTAPYIREHVDWAYKARESLPWGKQIPQELFFNYVLPYASFDERRDSWRRDFFERFLPVVRDCSTPAEAAQKLNREMFTMVKVEYHATKRPKPNQSPYESMEAAYASCTGLSVLLADACRAVCIPARLAGTPQWTTKTGNHTWVEVWDGQWHFVGAAEPDPDGLNRAWFVNDAAKADPTRPMNRIYATSFKQTPLSFPLVWNLGIDYVKGHDVTKYYTARKSVKITVLDRPGGQPVEAGVALYLSGEVYALGRTSGISDPAESGLRFEFAAGEKFDVEIRPVNADVIHTTLVTTTEEDQNVILTLADD